MAPPEWVPPFWACLAPAEEGKSLFLQKAPLGAVGTHAPGMDEKRGRASVRPRSGKDSLPTPHAPPTLSSLFWGSCSHRGRRSAAQGKRSPGVCREATGPGISTQPLFPSPLQCPVSEPPSSAVTAGPVFVEV